MDHRSSLEREFGSRKVYESDLLILAPSDALALVDRAREAGIRITGVDGFRIVGQGIQPDLGESLDMQLEKGDAVDTWRVARSFLEERVDADLVFEVGLE